MCDPKPACTASESESFIVKLDSCVCPTEYPVLELEVNNGIYDLCLEDCTNNYERGADGVNCVCPTETHVLTTFGNACLPKCTNGLSRTTTSDTCICPMDTHEYS